MRITRVKKPAPVLRVKDVSIGKWFRILRGGRKYFKLNTGQVACEAGYIQLRDGPDDIIAEIIDDDKPAPVEPQPQLTVADVPPGKWFALKATPKFLFFKCGDGKIVSQVGYIQTGDYQKHPVLTLDTELVIHED